ncbi:MAG: ABC transporter permease [Alphaproteobacteria bacterium]|nr:ABC transporter permease [Alphaproteobacteria bacterium]MDE2111463.1 ABC transporter permease [Alphaproteobacteria bacterium]MDE2494266.1 ABC transporter permease [Alphaproteobacteria bacterium]
MIWAIVSNGFRALRRDRGALILSFILPVAFFTIFAYVFGSMGSSATPRVKVIVVDQDRSAVSQRLVRGLRAEPSLEVSTAPAKNGAAAQPAPYTAATAEQAVKQGDAPVAILIPKGFGAAPFAFGPMVDRPQFVILHDISNPVAGQVASGMLQKVVMTSLSDIMADQGMKYLDQSVGGLMPGQRNAFDASMARYKAYLARRRRQGVTPEAQAGSIIAITLRNVVGQRKKNPMVSFYAAGIGVMFLLFTASGAAGSLIDEAESGALDRMLSARVSMTTLLAGKLLYCALLAFLQLTVMFLWGAAVFQLDLFSHIPGFVVMTGATAFAVSAFGMLLASLSRTRQQQAAIATLLILVMSALGGSMFPRFLMPDFMQKLGLFTFNAWAIDGYTKVFWRDEPVWHLLPQVEVLIGSGIALFLLARVFARRWEAV